MLCSQTFAIDNHKRWRPLQMWCSSQVGLGFPCTSISDPTMDWENCPHTKPIPTLKIAYTIVMPGCMNQSNGLIATASYLQTELCYLTTSSLFLKMLFQWNNVCLKAGNRVHATQKCIKVVIYDHSCIKSIAWSWISWLQDKRFTGTNDTVRPKHWQMLKDQL